MPPVDFDTLVTRAVLDQFAVEVLFYPLVSDGAGAFAYTVRGIFDADHEMVLTEVAKSEQDSAGHSSTGPVLMVRLAELAAAPKPGDRVTIAGKIYGIWDVQPDGEGVVDLVLKERK